MSYSLHDVSSLLCLALILSVSVAFMCGYILTLPSTLHFHFPIILQCFCAQNGRNTPHNIQAGTHCASSSRLYLYVLGLCSICPLVIVCAPGYLSWVAVLPAGPLRTPGRARCIYYQAFTCREAHPPGGSGKTGDDYIIYI